MEEFSNIVLGEISRELHSAYHKSLHICLLNLECKTCPFYDERMENKYGTKCFGILSGIYSLKLTQIANGIEAKGE